MARIELHTEHIEVPYPNTPVMRLEIVAAAPGELSISRDDAEYFVSGTIEYNMSQWAPRVQLLGDTVRVAQGKPFDIEPALSTGKVNRWDLRIGDKKPFALVTKSGVNRGRWDLGGLPITGLRIETGVSENSFTFKTSNPVEMEKLELMTGVASVELDGLLNANPKRVDVKGGVGSVALRFTGRRLMRDIRVKIEGGVGSFAIVVDETVPTHVKVTGMAGVTARGEFSRKSGSALFGGDYETPTYDSTYGPRLDISITAGVAGISLDTRKDTWLMAR